MPYNSEGAWVSTLVSITGAGIPSDFLDDYNARGVTMSLAQIDAAKRMRRTINGELKDVSRAQFKKYQATIQCSDHESPPLTSAPAGTIVDVICLSDMGTTGEDTSGDPVRLELEMMIADWQVQRDEWDAQTGWSLVLVEV